MFSSDTDTADLIIAAPWVLPVAPQNRALKDHAIVVKGQRIAAVLPAADALDIPCEQRVELSNHIVAPGLVNAHGHAAMALFRGMADDLPLQTWLEQHIWPAEAQWLSDEMVADGTRLAIVNMLRGGATCFSDMYFFPEAVARVSVELGMRAHLSTPVIQFPGPWGSGPEEYLHKGLALRDEYLHSDLLTFGLGPHAAYTVDDASMDRVAMIAAELPNCGIHIHMHETAAEVQASLDQYGMRPLQRIHARGLLGPDTQCAHMVWVDEADIELMVQSGASAVHCPRSNLKLASGFSPVQTMRDAGINVALGTDGAASNNQLSMLSEMNLAALLAKAVAGDAAALPAAEALYMATLAGARAIGCDADIGSLEPGKCADIIAVDVGAAAMTPIYDPLSHLAYAAGNARVSHSWINGRMLLHDGDLTLADEGDILVRAQRWADQIHGATT